MERLLLTLFTITFSLVAGYLCRCLAHGAQNRIWLERLDLLRHGLQTAAVFYLLPFSAMLSLWGLPAPNPRLVALPFLGIFSWICGGTLAICLARLLRLDRSQTGSLYCCGTFTNIGAIGSFICVMFLGENSIALVALYRLCEELFYYSISFPIAKWYAQPAGCSLPTLRAITFDPVLRIIVGALGFGLVLNLLGVPRPQFCGTLASSVLIAATVLFLLAIGFSLRLSSLRDYIPQSLGICIIKFILMPTIMLGIAYLLELDRIEEGLPLKVVAVMSAMPVAMSALVPPAIFHLDMDLANSCWIYSTAGLLAVLPALLALLQII